MNKSEIAKELGVSRAYVTMISNGNRPLTNKLDRKLKRIGVNLEGQTINPKSCLSANSSTPP